MIGTARRATVRGQRPVPPAHPVERALRRRAIETSVRDFSIRLHLLADGEQVAADAVSAAKVLMVAFEVLTHAGLAQSPAGRVIRGAISTVVQLSERGWAWRRCDAWAIDTGLQHAADVAKTARAENLRRAWEAVDRMETQAQPDHETRINAST
jgi:hypothetical protein